VTFDDGAIRCNLQLYKPFYTELRPELSAELNKFSREDIAAGLQVHCERLVAQWAEYWLRRLEGHNGNICLAGGLFANVRINQVVGEIPGVKNVFIFPHMGDGGLTVGAAALALHRSIGQAKLALPTAYLGPQFSDAEIVKAIEELGDRVKALRVANKAAETADALVQGKVVGFFEGRMEFGPRALGARSILYHTRDRSANDWLNKRMHRSEFMPFAPVSPVEFAGECYVDWAPDQVCAQFMTKTYHCTEAFKSKHPAVVHIDGTARPQIVYPHLHGRYYDVVRLYCERTGERALINTSFNMHEEPIVCSSKDALEALSSDIVDVLMIGDHRVERA
jgi:carbamoyltransferase